MMSENRIEKLCNLSWRSSRNRIVCAICNKRNYSGACRLNNLRNIQWLVANIKFFTKHPNFCELVAVRAVCLALRTKRDPLLPSRKITQTANGILHRCNSAVEIACRVLHEWLLRVWSFFSAEDFFPNAHDVRVVSITVNLNDSIMQPPDESALH